MKDIDRMTPQEINEAVARKLGWTKLYLSENIGVMNIAGKRRPTDTMDSTVPEYCERIMAAWEIMEWLTKNDYLPDLCYLPREQPWRFEIQPPNDMESNWSECADTAPMAICKAFLKLP